MIGILIVEDERIVAMALEKALRRMGYMVTGITDSGEGAIQKATQVHPDLVLMDIRLKGEMDGIQAADQIQRRLDVPVIYLTAYGDEQTLQRATATAAYGYILKPFEERDVRIAVDMALYKHLAERKLKDRERWLTATLRSIGEAVIAADEMALVRLMNPVAERVTGWSEQEALGMNLAEVVAIEQRSGGRLAIKEMIRRTFGQRKAVAFADAVLTNRHGVQIPVEGNLGPVQDEKGHWRGLVAVLRDVTERQTAELALRDSQERYGLLLQAAPQAMLLVSLDGQVLECSERMADLLGTRCEAILRQPIAELELWTPEQRVGWNTLLSRVARGLDPWPLHVRKGQLTWELWPAVLKRGDLPQAVQLVAREIPPS